MNSLNSGIELALPFLAWIASYAIQQGRFPAYINTLIACVTILLTAIGTVILQGRLTGNASVDLLLILTTSISLQSEALDPLHKYLRNNFPSLPSALFAQLAQSAQSNVLKQPAQQQNNQKGSV